VSLPKCELITVNFNMLQLCWKGHLLNNAERDQCRDFRPKVVVFLLYSVNQQSGPIASSSTTLKMPTTLAAIATHGNLKTAQHRANRFGI